MKKPSMGLNIIDGVLKQAWMGGDTEWREVPAVKPARETFIDKLLNREPKAVCLHCGHRSVAAKNTAHFGLLFKCSLCQMFMRPTP